LEKHLELDLIAIIYISITDLSNYLNKLILMRAYFESLEEVLKVEVSAYDLVHSIRMVLLAAPKLR
jgi:hypothetical protein